VSKKLLWASMGLVVLLAGCQLFNSGYIRPNVNAPSLQARWVFKGGLSNWYQGEPTVAADDGKVYFIGTSEKDRKVENQDNNHLWSLKANTGAEVWKFKFSGHMGTVPSVADGKVYFGTSELGTGTYYLYCVDAKTGTLNWRVPLGDYNSNSSTPIISDGIVYLGTQPAITDEDVPYFVYAIEANNGKEVWKRALDGGVSSIALAGGTLYAGNQDGPMTGEATYPTYLHALDAKTGNELWRFETEAEVSAPPVVIQNTVFFVSGNGYWGNVLRRLDKVSGHEEWQFKQENSTLSAPVISGTNLYVGVNEVREHCIDNCGPPRSYTDYLYTLDPATGAEKAKVKVELPVTDVPVMADGVLYSLDYAGLLYGTDAGTSQIKWKFDLGTSATAQPVVYEGLIYVASRGPGGLFALTLPSSTPAPAPTM
jgi:outer membrane protein assembly factor BamB